MIKTLDKLMPIKHVISFNKLLMRYEEIEKGDDAFLSARASHILKTQEPFPELRDGFTDVSLLLKHRDIIKIILQDTFSEVLTGNEIKVASLPYNNVIFNSSKRFQNILRDAGKDYEPSISNIDNGNDYIMACIVILNFYYGYKLDFRKPFFYNIPDKNGVMHHYRILYNADFLEILPTEKAKKITRKDVDELLANPDNIALWMEKVPPGSFISKGFVISNMFDVTTEHSISQIKSQLIASDKRGNENFIDDLQEIFRSFFRLPDIEVGFVVYNSRDNLLEPVYGNNVKSFILNGKGAAECKDILCEDSYSKLLNESSYFTIPNLDEFNKATNGAAPYEVLNKQGVKSVIFAPIASDGELLGVLEVVSNKKNVLNGVNANRLDDIMPFIVSAVVRSKNEEENYIDAIIQNECTSVHSSVYWRFREEAKFFIKDQLEGLQPSFKEITFKDVFPLYGQIDIKDSSKARNDAIQKDLLIQLTQISKVLENTWQKYKLPVYEELLFRVTNHLDSIKEILYTNSEQSIFDFVQEEIVPVFNHIKNLDKDLEKKVIEYENRIDLVTNSYYDHRKQYDDSVTLINKKLASVLDKKQVEAQEMFPHYFERYKTDGVEHNMYVGASISQDKEYNNIYLNNLRLWQLQAMCEMENRHYQLKKELPVPLDAASLILVHNSSLSIRFRMDEKKFDVDGTYNARYEVIKKRIDKSYIKGTSERLTQTGKISIVYSQKKDELEYLRYIKFLKSKGYFTDKVEIVELEGLQGVSGLKAIRAEILYKTDKSSKKTYTYSDLMEELKE